MVHHLLMVTKGTQKNDMFQTGSSWKTILNHCHMEIVYDYYIDITLTQNILSTDYEISK